MKLKKPKHYFIDNNIVESFKSVQYSEPKQYDHDTVMGFATWFVGSLVASGFLSIAIFVSKKQEQLPVFSFSWGYVFIILNFLALVISAFFHQIVFYSKKIKHKFLLKSFQTFIFHNPENLRKLLQFINFNSLMPSEKDIINKDFSEHKLSLRTLEILSSKFNENLLDENLDILTSFANNSSNEKKDLSFFNSKK